MADKLNHGHCALTYPLAISVIEFLLYVLDIRAGKLFLKSNLEECSNNTYLPVNFSVAGFKGICESFVARRLAYVTVGAFPVHPTRTMDLTIDGQARAACASVTPVTVCGTLWFK
jgi:hypothetical protein